MLGIEGKLNDGHRSTIITSMEALQSSPYPLYAALFSAGCFGALGINAIIRKCSSMKQIKTRATIKTSHSSNQNKESSNLTTSSSAEDKSEDSITKIPSFYIPRLVSYPIRPAATSAFDLLKGFHNLT